MEKFKVKDVYELGKATKSLLNAQALLIKPVVKLQKKNGIEAVSQLLLLCESYVIYCDYRVEVDKPQAQKPIEDIVLEDLKNKHKYFLGVLETNDIAIIIGETNPTL